MINLILVTHLVRCESRITQVTDFYFGNGGDLTVDATNGGNQLLHAGKGLQDQGRF